MSLEETTSEELSTLDGIAVRSLGHGPRLVGLHGGPGLDHHVLLCLARRLAIRFTVDLPDLPGHGGSTPPSGRPPGLRALETRLAGWLRRHGDGVEVLLGHSFGAWLARELVRRRRVSPRALVLVSPPGGVEGDDLTAVRRAFDLVLDSLPDEEPSARREIAAHVHAESRGAASEEILADLGRTVVRPPALYRALLRNLHRRLTAPLRAFDPGCPTLVLCGAEDRTTRPPQVERVAASMAGARFELLDDAGHYPFAERCDGVAEKILSFLDQALRNA